MATNGINIEQSNADLAKSRIHSWKKFGLRSSPFDNSFKCNYGSRIEHFQSSLNKLNSFCNAHENIAVITGTPGTGKSLIFNDFMKEHGEPLCKIHIDADFCSVNILNAISSSLNLNLMVVGSNQNSYILQIAHAILTQKTKFILVCDDSHKLSESSFNTIIELLTNIKLTDYIKVILFGAPDIFERIVKYAVCKGSRIQLQHIIMQPLAEIQLNSYLHNCLAKSGWPGALPEIPTAVLHDIFNESGGIPRRVNIVAEKILLSYLEAPIQTNQVEYMGACITTKEHRQHTKKQHSHMRKIAYAWQNSATTIIVSMGFVIMLYGSYIWYVETLTANYHASANTISEIKEATLASTTAPQVVQQNNDQLLDRINHSLEKSKPINTLQFSKPSFKAQALKGSKNKEQNLILKSLGRAQIKPKIENLSGYTIQLSSSSNLKALVAFKREQNLAKEMYIYKTSRQNKPWYVLIYSSFITKQEATDALRQLQQTKKFTGLWIKSFLDIHLSSSSYIKTS
tara:strand:+ start:1387 stop:2925 length:1539 start_codon:yes stop_codon:yes gene_type:complete